MNPNSVYASLHIRTLLPFTHQAPSVEHNHTILCTATSFLVVLAKMEKLFADTSAWILTRANPAMSLSQQATADWPVMSLQSAIQWCGVYAVIVVVGLIRMTLSGGNDAKGNSTVDAVVKPVQVVYNLVQVRFLAGGGVNGRH